MMSGGIHSLDNQLLGEQMPRSCLITSVKHPRFQGTHSTTEPYDHDSGVDLNKSLKTVWRYTQIVEDDETLEIGQE